MAEDVKTRRYRSPRRREQAAQTRERILASAGALLTARGYGGATIAAIAEDAGVAPETVYARFGSKRRLLAELVQRAVRGPDPAPVPQQATPRRIAAGADQREQLRLFVDDVAPRIERVGPLYAVVQTAAPEDPEIAALLGRMQETRLANLRTLVEALARNGPLRTDPDTALHSVWAVCSPDVHRLLTRERGWDGTRYRAWLRTTLEALLLPAPGAPGLVIGAGADEEGDGASRPRPRPEEPS